MFRKTQKSLCLFCLSVLCVLFPGVVTASESDDCQVEITTYSPDPQVTDILETVNFRYVIKHNEKCQVRTFLTAKDPAVCLKPSITVRPTELTTRHLNIVDVKCKYRRPGHFYLAPVYFEVQSPNSAERIVHHPSMPHVMVSDNTEKTALTTPPYDLMTIMPWRQSPVAAWFLGSGAAIVLCVLFLFVYARVARKKTAEEIVEIQTPIQEFKSEISLLVDVTPMTLDEYKVYHDRLSYALRQYLEKRFSMRILNMTTSQLIQHLRENAFPEEICDTAERLLTASDYVKFALDAPSQADNLIMLRDMGILAENLEKYALEQEMMLAEENASDVR